MLSSSRVVDKVRRNRLKTFWKRVLNSLQVTARSVISRSGLFVTRLSRGLAEDLYVAFGSIQTHWHTLTYANSMELQYRLSAVFYYSVTSWLRSCLDLLTDVGNKTGTVQDAREPSGNWCVPLCGSKHWGRFQWRRNEFESGGNRSGATVGGAPIRRKAQGKKFWSCPSIFWL